MFVAIQQYSGFFAVSVRNGAVKAREAIGHLRTCVQPYPASSHELVVQNP